jgi:hypothetical protein
MLDFNEKQSAQFTHPESVTTKKSGNAFPCAGFGLLKY